MIKQEFMNERQLRLSAEKNYRKAYSELGEERVQLNIPKDLVQLSRKSSKTRNDETDKQDARDYEKFWLSRRDINWAEIPMRKIYNKRLRRREDKALVTEILVHLAPSSTFNPFHVWANMKRSVNPELEISSTTVSSKSAKIVEDNKRRMEEDMKVAEITRIRNSKDNLISLVRQLSSQRAREVLLVEILRKAMTEPRNIVEVFDVLWAIESFGISETVAPPPRDASDILPSVKDSSLAYDNLKTFNSLLKEARKLRSKEKDIIRFQLNEMSDRLPPLSKYSFDFKLDHWQIRALEFLDAGKSLVICAPTSSGKTVLSTYVALIGKYDRGELSKMKAAVKSSKAASGAKPTNDARNDEEDDEEEEGDLSEDEDDENDDDSGSEEKGIDGAHSADNESIRRDRSIRLRFRYQYPDFTQRVLFVVPTEPLVWQVAAFFTKIFWSEGDKETKVAVVTNQMSYHSVRTLGVMPQVVVGTPLALESSLTKCRGLVGRHETVKKVQGDLMPGGFDHFDWAIYDEVHSLDGEEGDALQRLIRMMNCNFLALSATVGNAEELRDWFERVKGDQLLGVEAITVLPEESSFYGSGEVSTVPPPVKIASLKKKGGKDKTSRDESLINFTVTRSQDQLCICENKINASSTLSDFFITVWESLNPDLRDLEPNKLHLQWQKKRIPCIDSSNILTFLNENGVDIKKLENFEVDMITFDLKVVRTMDSQSTDIRFLSPSSSILCLKRRIVKNWPMFTAEALQLFRISGAFENSNSTLLDGIKGSDGKRRFTLKEPVLSSSNEVKIVGYHHLERGTQLLIGNVLSNKIDIVTVISSVPTNEFTNIKFSPALVYDYSSEEVCYEVNSYDLVDNAAPVSQYGIDVRENNQQDSSVFIVQVRSLVNLLSHQVRFINLQRYVWRNSSLIPINPLAAVESVEKLRDGILDNSSLSFTSKDSFRLWLELERTFPPEAIARYSPDNFFSAESRITLQQTKDYENLLKKGLRELALSYPLEVQELLFTFQFEDPDKEIDICEMLRVLQNENATPCLAFHLNAFEAIRIFQQLLAGLEWRQKCEHPTYYLDLQAEKDRLSTIAKSKEKSCGGNEKKLEDEAKAGEIDSEQSFTVDLHEPHPKYRFVKGQVMLAEEYVYLCDEMEKFDGFEKRDEQIMKDPNFKGKNEEILEHALMRGLKRGIGLYINEVSSPAYRRAVQRLASQGKLAVVVSDDSLAFGVNMPFRTCIFCGEMEGQLTPLMAQQMSGRAGRRGLDTQGNLVYIGARASFIRELMIGRVANITGENFPPRYETLFLQGMLSQRHVGWSRIEVVGGKSLDEFVNGEELPVRNYGTEWSRQILVDLDLITSTPSGVWIPRSGVWEILCMVWELRNNVPESVCLGRLLIELNNEVDAKVREMLLNNQQSSISVESSQQDYKKDKAMYARLVPFFFSIILQILDRRPHDESTSKCSSLQSHSLFGADRPQERDTFNRWRKKIYEDQIALPSHLGKLRLFNGATENTELDGTLFQCCLDRDFVFSLSDSQRQAVKQRIWHVGSTLKTMHNTLWPCSNFEKLTKILHSCFRHLWYINSEIVRSQVNFPDISSSSRETRADRNAASPDRPEKAMPWKDNDKYSEMRSTPVPYCTAICRVVERVKQMAYSTSNPQEQNEILSRMCRIFSTILMGNDLPLIRLALNYEEADVPIIVGRASSCISPHHRIGTLAWACLKLFPTSAVSRFPLYLKGMIEYESETLLDEVNMKSWYDMSIEENMMYLPSGSTVTASELEAMKKSKGMMAFIEWLDQEEDEEGEEGDEEDDDEES